MRARPEDTLDAASFAVWRDFERDLQAKQCRPYTITHYGWALIQLTRFAGGTPLLKISRDQITRYLTGLGAQGRARATIDTRYRALRRFYRWCDAEELLPGGNPITRVPRPQPDDKLVTVMTPEDEAALLRACRGKTFEDLRDTALIRLLLTPGAPRAAEICGLVLGDVDMVHDTVLITCGKWARDRLVPFGPLTGKALSRYLRARAQRPDAGDSPRKVWLGKKGPLTRSGLAAMLTRRCEQAGIAKVHPHQLRHTSVVRFKRDGGDIATGKKLYGWKDSTMWEHYGEAAAAAVAVEHGRAAAARMETAI